MTSRGSTPSSWRVFYHEHHVAATMVTLDVIDDATPAMSAPAPLVE